MKYVIKNCECKVKGKTTLCVRDIPYKKCENITGCVMKRIVEKCREDWEDSTVLKFQRELLDMLDIEECE